MLGASDTSAHLAAKLGLRFCFAHFLRPPGAAEALRLYRAEFTPSIDCPHPYAAVAVTAICAASDELAQQVASSKFAWYCKDRAGISEGLPAPEEAQRITQAPEYREFADSSAQTAIVGAPARVATEFQAMADRLDVAEIIVTTPCYDFATRARSFALVAGALSLAETAPLAVAGC
jgi:luciferase family oxidoreductase group 1